MAEKDGIMPRNGSVGRTWSGKEIIYGTVGGGTELRVLAGGFSAADSISPELLSGWIAAARRCAETDETLGRFHLSKMPENMTVCVIPDMNPDGKDVRRGLDLFSPFKDRVEKIQSGFPNRTWEANIRGTDLRRNFRFSWNIMKMKERENGIFMPAPNGYGGEYPESELETASLCSFLRKSKPTGFYVFDDTEKGILVRSTSKNYDTVHQKVSIISQFIPMEVTDFSEEECVAAPEPWAESELSVPSFRIGLKGLKKEEALELITLCAVL